MFSKVCEQNRRKGLIIFIISSINKCQKTLGNLGSNTNLPIAIPYSLSIARSCLDHELNSEKQILPTHLLSSFTREEKRLYHLIMESKRTKASAQAIDASKISKEPSKEYIQTTSGIIMYPSENSYSNLSLENRYILALDSLTSQNNGASNE